MPVTKSGNQAGIEPAVSADGNVTLDAARGGSGISHTLASVDAV